jgi:hypothetical protein
MARSQYIYLVSEFDETTWTYQPIAGFTVLYEMLEWVRRNPGPYTLYRIRDGMALTKEQRRPVEIIP